MIILDCIQGDDVWKNARIGMVSASKFGDILTPTGKPTTGVKIPNYMNTLIHERLTNKKTETHCTDAMKRGIELEPEARDLYANINSCDPVEIGMAYLNDEKLISCSPDAMIGDEGLWENKAPLPHNHIKCLFEGKMPNTHIPQVQGQIWIMGKEWCDFMSYCPDIKPLIVRVYRDDEYIKALSDAVQKFAYDMMIKFNELKG